MWKFFGYLVLIDCFGSFPIFNDFFYGFAVSYVPLYLPPMCITWQGPLRLYF